MLAENVTLNWDLQSIFWKKTHCAKLQFDAHGRLNDQYSHSGAVPMDHDESLCSLRLCP
jgi:hypothetical protein